jgi:hypothetical protein
VLAALPVPTLLSHVFAFLFGGDQRLFFSSQSQGSQASLSVCGDNFASCSDSSFA